MAGNKYQIQGFNFKSEFGERSLVSKTARAQRKNKDKEWDDVAAHLKRVNSQMIWLVGQIAASANGKH